MFERPPEAPFYWNFSIRKDVSIIQVSVPALPTPPVFRVVLPHTEESEQRLIRRNVYEITTNWVITAFES